MEVAYLHDWNVILVPEGRDFRQIIAAQRRARMIDNGQPTAVVYRTTKGWKYGIEGRLSHGAGHKLCSDGFYEAVQPLLEVAGGSFPTCEPNCQRCGGGSKAEVMEQCLWDALLIVRKAMEQKKTESGELARRLRDARERLDCASRKPRDKAPDVNAIYSAAKKAGSGIPDELTLKPGSETTLRGELGKTLNYYNKTSGGAIFAAAADLLGSTSVNVSAKGFPEGYYNSRTNPGARLLSIGGICEDAMSGILAGIATYGRHTGAGSSYGAFIAALGHIASRLHSIGNQARQSIKNEPYKPYFLVCAHAGVKTGEDGPTHADPQALQLLQENFPAGTMITLTPWDPQELFPLVTAALDRRPCVIAPFVTRPNEPVLDRKALGLAPATESALGVYRLRRANGKANGTVVLQGSEVAYAFVLEALPLLAKEGIDVDVYYVASTELFDRLPAAERERLFPRRLAAQAMGITGFTLPTMYRWVCSDRGRVFTMHAFQKGHYLGSGQAEKVVREAGLDGESQFKAIVRFVKEA
jgi:transketolase